MCYARLWERPAATVLMWDESSAGRGSSSVTRILLSLFSVSVMVWWRVVLLLERVGGS